MLSWWPTRAGNNRRALKEKRHLYLQDIADLLQATGADAIGPLLIPLHLLKRKAIASPSFVWLMPRMSRRMRTRLATCLSIGLRSFLATFLSRRRPPFQSFGMDWVEHRSRPNDNESVCAYHTSCAC
jgi:hypothetical protein